MTADDIERLVAAEFYWKVPGDAVVVCALTLINGFTVIGHGGCVDPDEFDEEIGKEIARRDAIHKVWGLEGYRRASIRHAVQSFEKDVADPGIGGA